VLSGAALDSHTLVLSSGIGAVITGRTVEQSDANDLVEQLNAASVQRAVVLNLAYALPSDQSIRAENNFASTEVARYPTRLIGFCGINPNVTGAVTEIDRCLALPGMEGVALHLPDSDIDLSNQRHVDNLRAVLTRVDELDAPVVLHVGTPQGLPLGAKERDILVSIVIQYPELRILFAHCAGPVVDQNLEAIVQAFNAKLTNYDMSNLFVDISRCLHFYEQAPQSKRELIVWQLRLWGLDRVLFGSDYLMIEPSQTPIEALVTLALFPFTQEEIDTITRNDGSMWLEGS
jgi:predicted TIM-barrel fold metal-dependent hydrolase